MVIRILHNWWEAFIAFILQIVITVHLTGTSTVAFSTFVMIEVGGGCKIVGRSQNGIHALWVSANRPLQNIFAFFGFLFNRFGNKTNRFSVLRFIFLAVSLFARIIISLVVVSSPHTFHFRLF